jgi:hypothetical protein
MIASLICAWIQSSDVHSINLHIQLQVSLLHRTRTLLLSDFVGGKYRGEVKKGVFGS